MPGESRLVTNDRDMHVLTNACRCQILRRPCRSCAEGHDDDDCRMATSRTDGALIRKLTVVVVVVFCTL